MPISFADRVSVPRDVLINALGGESVLLNLANECYYGLDEVGTRMWRLLTTCASIEEAHQVLLQEYEVEPEQLRADLERLVDELVQNGLLEIERE